MAQNSPSPVITDISEQDPLKMTDLKSRLVNLEDPLDLQMIEDLSLYFKHNLANPDTAIELYKECITSLEKEWKPFIDTLASTLDEGAVACNYLMVGYSECLKVIGAREIHTTPSNISSFHDKITDENEIRMSPDNEVRSKQNNLLNKTLTDLLHTVESNSLELSQRLSAAISHEIASSSLSSDLAPSVLNKFIWEDGKSYKSRIGIVTANRDDTIAINLTSPVYKSLNILGKVRVEPKKWEFLLNRDLDKLNSYLSKKSDMFKGGNQKAGSEKIDILKDLADVPVNYNQWINASVIRENPKCILHCKIEGDLKIKIQGFLPLCNLEELIQTICLMVLLKLEKSLELSKSALPFLWNSIYKNCHKFMETNKLNEDFFDKSSCNLIHRAFSEGLCEEKPISPQSVTGDISWQLTDNCNRYVTVLFCYRFHYSTFPIAEREHLEIQRWCVMGPPSPDDMVKLLEMESQLRNIKTSDQSEFLKPLLYMRKDDLESVRKRKKLA